MTFDAAAHLHALRTKGFHALRPGRIHMRCPGCGRKQSNDHRTEYDPDRAVLREACCDKCCMGHKDCGATYFSKRGRQVDWEEAPIFSSKGDSSDE